MIDNKLDSDKAALAVETIEGKWSVQAIISVLNRDGASFSDIKSDLSGISNKVLSDTLRDLQQAGILRKDDKKYVLTVKGRKVVPALELLESWAERHLDRGLQRIMVVEEDEDRAEMYSRWLEEDYEIILAHSRSEAVKKLDSSIDLVLLNFNIHESSVESLAQNIVSLCAAEVIGVSRETDIKDPGFEVVELLSQPLQKDQLRNAVRKALD